jgi:hypothetical protein
MTANRYQIASYRFDLRVTAPHLRLARTVTHALGAVLYNFQPERGLSSFGGLRDAITIENAAGVIRSHPGTDGHRVDVRLDENAPDDVIELLDSLEPDIVNLAIRESPNHVWIHGACLVRNGEATLLIAESGTGKTTLSLGMLAYGYRLITDDVILIDPATCGIVPVPRCPKVRPPAPDYLREIGFDLTREASLLGRYVLLPRDRLHRLPLAVPITRLYILTRKEGSPGTCEEMDMSSGILALLSRSNLLAMDSTLGLAYILFQNTRFYAMNLHHYPDDLRLVVGD